MNEEEQKKLVADLQEDFARRKAARLKTERLWTLCLAFVNGDQYCDVSPEGDLVREDKKFYWQSRRVFNHIAPVLGARLAKLSKMRPKVHAKPFSDEEKDRYAAKLADGILEGAEKSAGLDDALARAAAWSEICGTAFYKITWNGEGGMPVGKGEEGTLYEGDAAVTPLSPFEIYPDSLSAENLGEVRSLIHAKAIPCSAIHEKYGVWVAGRSLAEIALPPFAGAADKRAGTEGEDYAVVIERYTAPTPSCPEGKLEIAAGDTLLYAGGLPYQNQKYGGRGFPFVQQKCVAMPSSFFGTSVVARLIPLQRAYNAVRNRKHEFLNRLSMGVVAVEDGSVDTDELEEGGLSPGKILVYRQGSAPPALLDCGALPPEFSAEEKTLEEEFLQIGETDEITRDSSPTSVTSATGLQLLFNQYDERLSVPAKHVEQAAVEIGRQILRLYKQFCGTERLLRFTGSGKGAQLFYFSASDVEADDVVLECDDKSTPSKVREEILRLLELGLLNDENGRLTPENKNRVLEALGFASFAAVKDLTSLHEEKAHGENFDLLVRQVDADEYDDDAVHLNEHIRFLLSDDFSKEEGRAIKERFVEHIRQHRAHQKTQRSE